MTSSPQRFQTHTKGKLLLTAEYVVLDGAKALAIPSRLGQGFQASPDPELPAGILSWSSYDHQGNTWFQGSFQLANLKVLQTTDAPTSNRLLEIFHAIQRQKPEAWLKLPGLQVRMDLEFSRHWGLGTSSTLLAALAQWQAVDPYRLLWDTFGGSAYDIACAIADGPLLYQLNEGVPQSEAVDFHPAFAENLYLVYSGKKQNSREGISHYRAKFKSSSPLPLIEKIDTLTAAILSCTSLSSFETLLAEHETLIGEAIAIVPVQQKHFRDYWGQIKSLGAWGGDFLLATSNRSKEATQAYFQAKGLHEVYGFTDWLLLS